MFNPLTEKERINTTAPEISGPFHVELNAFRFFDGITAVTITFDEPVKSEKV